MWYILTGVIDFNVTSVGLKKMITTFVGPRELKDKRA
jgi:hypothetical protein